MQLNIEMNSPFYVISDTHFFHSRLAFDFGLRTQFKDIDEMNATIFNQWNDTVGADDKVFFLGDWVIGAENKYSTGQILHDELNGKKVFIQGNHDEHIHKFTNIKVVKGTIKVHYKGLSILLCHEPVETFEEDIMICGHVHDKLPFHFGKNKFNVSVEVINFTPVNINDIINNFQK